MNRSKRLPLILGACAALALLLAGGVFWLLQPAPPRQQPGPVGANPAPGQTRPAPQQPQSQPEDKSEASPPASVQQTETPAPAVIDPRRVDPPLPPPPPAIIPRPPAESGEGEIIPPAWRHDDLSGQALQVHRDLELTMRLLHDLLR